jgi:hypothetical protein
VNKNSILQKRKPQIDDAKKASFFCGKMQKREMQLPLHFLKTPTVCPPSRIDNFSPCLKAIG